MTITTTLQNLSGETPVAVNIAPHPETWGEAGYEESNGMRTATAKIIGDDPEYSLVRKISARSAKVFHPDHPSDIRAGMRYTVGVYTTSKVEDSVTGLISYEPVEVTISISHAGSTFDNVDDLLQFILSAVSELYDTVTTGVPDTVILAKASLGIVRVD